MRAASLLALGFLVVDYILLSPQLLGHFYFGKAFVAVYWGLEIFFLGGPRFVYRWWKDRGQKVAASRAAPAETVLILGRSQETDPVLRAIQAGQVAGLRPVGLISPRLADIGHSIRGVQILGSYADLRSVIEGLSLDGRTPQRMILCAALSSPPPIPKRSMRSPGATAVVSRTQPLVGKGAAPKLAPVSMEELLLRPAVEIDGRRRAPGARAQIRDHRGRRLDRQRDRPAPRPVRGAGGGDHREFRTRPARRRQALARAPGTRISGRLCDVRDRGRVFAVLAERSPTW